MNDRIVPVTIRLEDGRDYLAKVIVRVLVTPPPHSNPLELEGDEMWEALRTNDAPAFFRMLADLLDNAD